MIPSWLLAAAAGAGALLSGSVGMYLASARKQLTEARTAHELIAGAGELVNPLRAEMCALRERAAWSDGQHKIAQEQMRELRQARDECLAREMEFRARVEKLEQR